MLYDLHLIADAFLAEEEIGRQRGLEESETEGICPSDDQTTSRNENGNIVPLSMLPPVTRGPRRPAREAANDLVDRPT